MMHRAVIGPTRVVALVDPATLGAGAVARYRGEIARRKRR